MRAWMRWILAILDLRLRFTLHTFAGCGGRKAAWRRRRPLSARRIPIRQRGEAEAEFEAQGIDGDGEYNQSTCWWNAHPRRAECAA
jgi:hypothetical protein